MSESIHSRYYHKKPVHFWCVWLHPLRSSELNTNSRTMLIVHTIRLEQTALQRKILEINTHWRYVCIVNHQSFAALADSSPFKFDRTMCAQSHEMSIHNSVSAQWFCVFRKPQIHRLIVFLRHCHCCCMWLFGSAHSMRRNCRTSR